MLSQTLIDYIPSTEALLRLVLWLWVVVMLPATLTALVELAFGRSPGRLALQTGLQLLDSVTGALLGRPSADAGDRQAEALELLEETEQLMRRPTKPVELPDDQGVSGAKM